MKCPYREAPPKSTARRIGPEVDPSDGDLVAVHSRVQHHAEDRGAAVMHLFRFDGDHIAELWDVGQQVPAESPNANGMF